MIEHGDAIPPAPDAVLAPPAEGTSAASIGVALHPRPPRPGDLTVGWRAATGGIWIGVILAMAAVWSASAQLGLSTWWLGPRADPQPRVVQFAPFVAPALMLLGTINQVRRLSWFGLAASAVIGAVGLGDLGRVPSLALLELVIAAAAAAASLASLTGTYRPAPTPSMQHADDN